MATHSSVLAWRIPGMGEPGGLLSLGLHGVGHDWSNLAAAALAYEITQPIKANHPLVDGLSPAEMDCTLSTECFSQSCSHVWNGPHSIYGMCIALNKSVFTLVWLALEFFLMRSQGSTLGGLSQGLTWDLGYHHPCSCQNLGFLCPPRGSPALYYWPSSKEPTCQYR